MRDPMLQQAIGKSSRRGAHIQARPAGRRDLPVLQRRRQLEPSAAHIRLVLAQQPDGRILLNRRPRLIHLLFPHQHPAGQDQRPRPFAAGNQAPLHQQKIHAHFRRTRRHLRATPCLKCIRLSFVGAETRRIRNCNSADSLRHPLLPGVCTNCAFTGAAVFFFGMPC